MLSSDSFKMIINKKNFIIQKLQGKPLNVITLGWRESDNINQIYSYSNVKQMVLIKYDYNKWLISYNINRDHIKLNRDHIKLNLATISLA
jgi:hypothetical protein